MAKTNQKTRERKRGLVMLECFIKKLRRGLSLLPPRTLDINDVEFDEEFEAAKMVPDDVKEGHFAVFAAKCEEPKRFVVELGYLTNPAFLRLLEQAKEEYGFQQKGALAVPCGPEELQEILEDRRVKSADADGWAPYGLTIILSV